MAPSLDATDVPCSSGEPQPLSTRAAAPTAPIIAVVRRAIARRVPSVLMEVSFGLREGGTCPRRRVVELIVEALRIKVAFRRMIRNTLTETESKRFDYSLP